MAVENIAESNPSFEQCSLCSGHYLPAKKPFVQPNVNRQISKLLEVNISTLPSGNQFFSEYIPTCEDCISKVQRFEKLRVEMNIIRGDIVSSVLDTLLHIRSEELTPLEAIKISVIQRWSIPHSNGLWRDAGSHQVFPSPPKPKSPHKSSIKQPQNVPRLLSTKPTQESSTSNDVVVEIATATPHLVAVAPAFLDGHEIIIAEEFDVATVEVTAEQDQYTPSDTCDDYGMEDGDDDDGTFQNSVPETTEIISNFLMDANISQTKSKANANVDCENNPPPFLCDKCGRAFSIYRSAITHMRKCQGHDSEMKERVCTLCHMDFTGGSWFQLKLHYDLMHPNTVLDKCRSCKREFLPGEISDHICASSIIKAAPLDLECELCDVRFTSADTLQKHVRRRHKDLVAEGGNFACEICKKHFVLKSMMERHKKTHPITQKTNHQCDECLVYLASAKGLAQHKTLHTGELKYECEVCQKKFRSSQTKKFHMVVHTKTRDHTCDICGDTFALHSTMRKHWRRHNAPVPDGIHKCPIPNCYRLRFRRVDALKKHMTMHHRDTPECDQIFQTFTDVDEGPKKKVNSKLKSITKRKIKKEEKCDNAEEERGWSSAESVEDEAKKVDIGPDLIPTKRSSRIAARRSVGPKSAKQLWEAKLKQASARSKRNYSKKSYESKRTRMKRESMDYHSSNTEEKIICQELSMSPVSEDGSHEVTVKDEPIDNFFEESNSLPTESLNRNGIEYDFSRIPRLTLRKLPDY